MTVHRNIDQLEQARFNMIEQQIRPWDVLDSTVLGLLGQVKREDFVPAAFRSLAFADMEIPLPAGQSLLAPRVQARLIQDLGLQKTDLVLEIGAGSGFMTALMAQMVRHVVALEIEPELVEMAKHNLHYAGIANAEVLRADGSKPGLVQGPFDAIVLTGSVALLPHDLMEQLQIGGRLIAIVGDEPVMSATLVQRNTATDFTTRTLWETQAPRLQGFAEPSRFHF